MKNKISAPPLHAQSRSFFTRLTSSASKYIKFCDGKFHFPNLYLLVPGTCTLYFYRYLLFFAITAGTILRMRRCEHQSISKRKALQERTEHRRPERHTAKRRKQKKFGDSHRIHWTQTATKLKTDGGTNWSLSTKINTLQHKPNIADQPEEEEKRRTTKRHVRKLS